MWDLFCGLKGASAAFKKRGWDIVSVDIEPIFRPTLLRDISDLRVRGEDPPEFVWGSPPCTEYALRRFDKSIQPSLNLVVQARRVIRDLRPRFWCIENVRHAVPYITSLLGPHRMTVGPFFLWGNFPKFLARPVPLKGSPRGPHWLRSATRAKIPLSLSEDMERAVSYVLDQEETQFDRDREVRSLSLFGQDSPRAPRAGAVLDPEQDPVRRRDQGAGDVAALGPIQ